MKTKRCKLYVYHADGALQLTGQQIQKHLIEYGCRLLSTVHTWTKWANRGGGSNQTISNIAYAILYLIVLYLLIFGRMQSNTQYMLPTKGNMNWISPMQAKYGTTSDLSLMMKVVQAEVMNGRSSVRTVTQKLHFGESLDRYCITWLLLVILVHMLSRFSHKPTARAVSGLTRALHYAYNSKCNTWRK